MRIALVVGIVVMLAMGGDPMRRRILQAAGTQERKATFEPEWADEAAMREEPMEAKINPEQAEDKNSDDQKNDTCPAKEPRKKRQYSDQVNCKKAVGVVRLPPH